MEETNGKEAAGKAGSLVGIARPQIDIDALVRSAAFTIAIRAPRMMALVSIGNIMT